MSAVSPLEVRRILFVRTDRMGDVLMNVPAIRSLRASFPKAWMTVLVDRSVAPLLQGHPDIDEVMALDTGKLRKNFWTKAGLLAGISKIRYDMIVVSNPDKFMHAAGFLCGIPKRVGHDKKGSFWLTHRLDTSQLVSKHEIERNLELVLLVGDRKGPGRFDLPVQESALKEVNLLLDRIPSRQPFVAVHTGTSNPAKRWALDRFAGVCLRIQKDLDAHPVLIGGPEERAQADALVKMCPSAPSDLVGRLSLGQLSALFATGRVRALLSADSGPVHVAWMHGTPVAVLYAKEAVGSDPARWGPVGTRSRAVFKPIGDISVDDAVAALREVLAP